MFERMEGLLAELAAERRTDRQLRDLAALRTDPDFEVARTDPLVRQVLAEMEA